MLEGFIDSDAVGVGVVIAIEGLKEVHLFGVSTNFTVGEAMHPAARVLPGTGGEKVAIPGVGHFRHGFVIPIRPTAAAGVMGDLAD